MPRTSAKRRVPYDVLVANEDNDDLCRIAILMIGEFGIRVSSALEGMVGQDPDVGFACIGPRGVDQLSDSCAPMDMAFIVGDVRLPHAANEMIHASRVASISDADLLFLVSPAFPDAVVSDLGGIDCCFVQVEDDPVQAARVVLAPTLAMLRHGIVGIAFSDIWELFSSRTVGCASHRAVSGNDQRGRHAARAALAAIEQRLSLTEIHTCFFTVYLGNDGALLDIQAVADTVQNAMQDDADVKFAAVADEDFDGQVGVTLIAVTDSGETAANYSS